MMGHPVVHMPPVGVPGVVGAFAHVGCVWHGFQTIKKIDCHEMSWMSKAGEHCVQVLAVLLMFKYPGPALGKVRKSSQSGRTNISKYFASNSSLRPQEHACFIGGCLLHISSCRGAGGCGVVAA